MVHISKTKWYLPKHMNEHDYLYLTTAWYKTNFLKPQSFILWLFIADLSIGLYHAYDNGDLRSFELNSFVYKGE